MVVLMRLLIQPFTYHKLERIFRCSLLLFLALVLNFIWIISTPMILPVIILSCTVTACILVLRTVLQERSEFLASLFLLRYPTSGHKSRLCANVLQRWWANCNCRSTWWVTSAATSHLARATTNWFDSAAGSHSTRWIRATFIRPMKDASCTSAYSNIHQRWLNYA